MSSESCGAASPRGAMGKKPNEKTLIPIALSYQWLEGSVVTPDAMGTMRDTPGRARAKGEDFVLPKALLDDIRFGIGSGIAARERPWTT
ncbi:MAG: hypothetical protein WBI82_00375 [Sphaerochaeta sp.]